MKSIKVPFKFDGGRLVTTTSFDTIAQQKIIDVLRTIPFERVMRHNYGANIERLLFEPIDELLFADFKVDAIQTLNESISRVQIIDMYMLDSTVTDYFTDVNTTMSVAVVYKLPLAAPQIVKLNLVVPGAINEDTPI